MLNEKSRTFNQMVDNNKQQAYLDSMLSDPNAVLAHRMCSRIYSLPYGSTRRHLIQDLLEVHDLPVNSKYCCQVHTDKDIQRLLKSGEYKIVSVYESSTHKKQYLVKA